MDADLDRRLLRFRNLNKREDAGALARDLLSMDRTRDAMEVAATGLRRKPDHVGLVVVLGRVLLDGGDLGRAQEAFLQASRMDRNNCEALRFLGETLLRRGDNQRAAKVLGRAIALRGNDEDIRRLHERATRLARGQAVPADPELDPVPEEEQRLFLPTEDRANAPKSITATSGTTPEEPASKATASSWPPRDRKKTLMMGSDHPGATHKHESEKPVSDKERVTIKSSPSIKISDVPPATTNARVRRSTTPHGVRQVNATLMFDPSVSGAPQTSPQSSPQSSLGGTQIEAIRTPQPAPETTAPETASETNAHSMPAATAPVESGALEVHDDDSIEVERHSTSKAPVEIPIVESISARPSAKPTRRGLAWLWLILLAIAIAAGAFFVVRGIDKPAQAKSDEALLRALLQTDKSELDKLATQDANPREQILAAAHAAFRDGLDKPAQLSIAMKQPADVSSEELEAARATLHLSKGELKQAIDAARRASVSANPSLFARYLAGHTLASAGLSEGQALLSGVVKDSPNYRDAVLALAMHKALAGERIEASKLLREAPSDDVEAIIPLFRSALETPAQPEKRTQTDRDLVARYGKATQLVDAFLHSGAADLEQAIQTSNVQDPLVLGLVASVALAREATAPALAAALRAQKLSPNHDGIRRLIAKSAFALNDPDAAWTALSGTDDHNEESLVLLGLSAAQTQNDAFISDALERIKAKGPKLSVALQALSIELRAARGEADEDRRPLLRDARALSAENPGHPRAIRAHIAAARAAKDVQEEGEAIDELVRATPQEATAHLQYGEYWEGRDDFDKAETGYTRALSIDPNQPQAARLLGELLLRHGHFSKAELHYRNAMAPGIEAAIGRTRALAGIGRNVDGLAELEKAAAGENLSDKQRLDLANAALMLSRPDHAERLVQELAQSENAQVEFIVTHAKALSAQGKAEQATEQLERALKLAPQSVSALLAKSEAAVHAGKPATAHKYLALVYPKVDGAPQPVQAHYWLLRGRAYLLEGGSKLEDAREALRGAVRLRGILPEAYFFLGESLASANSPEAAKAYADYVALAPNGQYIKRAERALGTRK